MNDRSMNAGLKVAKSLISAKLFREKRKFPRNRDEDKIEAYEYVLANDIILIHELGELVNKFDSANASASELGDGELFKKFLDWLGSEEFQAFMDKIMELIKLIFELIGGLV